MKYQVLFRIEKLELIDKLKNKIKNLQAYMDEKGDELDIEIVFSGPVVNHFKEDYSDFIHHDWDVALCANALKGAEMEDITDRNVRTVKAGIGEIIEKKSQGWIEFTIE